MINYEIIETISGTKLIQRTTEDGTITWIPIDEANSDYQAYLNKDNPQTGTISQELVGYSLNGLARIISIMVAHRTSIG